MIQGYRMTQWDKKNYVAISAIWYERFLECSRTQGTIEFPASVWRFYHSLLNLNKDDLAILNKVKNYKETVWEPKTIQLVRQQTQFTNDPDTIDFEHKQIIAQYIHELFSFIIQTIQDTGIGWHTTDDIQSFNITQE